MVDWSLISSVYFDERSMPSYLSRLRRDDRASVIRVRWYGDRDPGPLQELFIERKVHREGWTGERSYKVKGCSGPRQLDH